jgi:exonuclease SbcD
MHFADTHFGVESYGRLDPATGLNSRLLDFRESLCRAIDSAIERGVHLVVFSGDAYKSRDPSQTQQREFAFCMKRLTDRGIPVVMVTGNHDVPGVRGRAHAMEIYRTLGVKDIHIYSKPDLDVIETPGGKVQIAAMPYLMRGFMLAREDFQGKSAVEIKELMEAKYHEYLDDLASRADSKLPTILIGHFWVRNARLSTWQNGYFNVNEPQVNLSDLARPDVFDYVALGHIHKSQDMNKRSQPPVVYSGSPDYIDFGERNEDKSWTYVEVEKGKAEYEFVPIPVNRRLVEIDVDADTDSPTETILEEIAKNPIRNNIVRVSYRLSSDKAPLVREREIKEALAPAFMLVALRADIQRDHVSRTKILTESLDPMAALSHYIDSSDKLRPRKDALLPYAELLMEELRREESVQ